VLERAEVNAAETITTQTVGAEFGGVTFQQQAESWLYSAQVDGIVGLRSGPWDYVIGLAAERVVTT
jgi:hypothetical protein